MSPRWRPMRADDLPQVIEVAAVVHPNYPERPEIFAEKLALFPSGCLALADGALAGYAIAHPWTDAAPRLDARLHRLPARPTTFYLHDIGLAPAARGRGLARAALARLAEVAAACGLDEMTLVAIGGAAPYWRRRGFVATPAADLVALGYGADAIGMRRALPSAAFEANP